MRFTFALTVLSLLFASSVQSQSFREQFTEANLLTEDGYYGLAIPIWQQLLKEKPNNANLNYKLGRSYLSLGIDRDRALPYLVKASKDVAKIYDPFAPDFKSAPVETYFYLGKAYHIDTDLDTAEYYYQKFLTDASKKHYLRPEAEKGLEMCATARKLIANPVKAQIVNIGSPINSEFTEYSPIVAFDENTLYFTSRRMRTDGSNEGQLEATTGYYYEDMYVSYRSISGIWMEPELLNINVSDQHSSVVSMSPDGRKLYLYKIFGGVGNIYESDFVLGTGWTEPSLVGSNVNSGSNEFFATITADEQRLYFVSDRKGGMGGKDIWYCQKLPNGEWGKAINMGAPVNTPDDEDAPYLHPDGKTMYFSSNGHESMGGYDILYSQLEESGNWSAPRNLGYPINTTDDDHSYIGTPDGRRAYYSSKGANSLGSTDIYVVEYAEEEEEQAPSVDLSSFAVLKGWIFPPIGESFPSGLDITITNTATNEIEGHAKPVERNGSFVFIIPTGSSYEVDLKLDGKTVYFEQIDIPVGTKYQELAREIFLTPSTGGSPRIVALKEDVLGNVVRWKLSFTGGNESIPLGSRVLYLDGDGEILDTAYVSKDGFFYFRKLDEDYILKPIVVGADNSQLQISLVDNKNEVRKIDLIEVDRVFYERSKAPKRPETLTAQTPPAFSTEETATTAKPKRNDKITAVAQDIQSNSNQSIIIYMDYNVVSTFDPQQMNKAAQMIKQSIASKGTISISVEGGASRVPTGYAGGNDALATARLNNGKAALLEALKLQGVDINKISTIRENHTVSGPEFNLEDPSTKSKYTDYQYLKVSLN